MSFYKVTFDQALKRQVGRLPGKVRQEARQLITNLSKNPRPAGAIELKGHPGVYRLWLTEGRYRAVWEIIESEKRVEVFYVGPKPDYDELLIDERE